LNTSKECLVEKCRRFIHLNLEDDLIFGIGSSSPHQRAGRFLWPLLLLLREVSGGRFRRNSGHPDED
jgi:hypothetical protein